MPTAMTLTLYMTPQKYRQVRSRKGSSWLTSRAWAPSRAMARPPPRLNTVCSSRAGRGKRPVPGHGLAGGEHDAEEHGHGKQHLLQFHDDVAERQAGPGELQGRYLRRAHGCIHRASSAVSSSGCLAAGSRPRSGTSLMNHPVTNRIAANGTAHKNT